MPDPNLANEIEVLRKANFSNEEIEAWSQEQAKKAAVSKGLTGSVFAEPGGETTANIIRYVIPTLVGLATGNPALTAAVAGGSEVLARKTSPATQDEPGAMTAASGGLSAAAGGLSARYLEPVASRILSKLGTPGRLAQKKLLIGDELPTEQRIIYEVLTELGSAPSLGQTSARGLARRLDDVVRSSMGGREISKGLDEHNIKLIENATLEYLETFARTVTNRPLLDANGIPRELAKRKFGELFRSILTRETDLAKKATRSLYGHYNLIVGPENLRVDFTPIRKALEKQKDNMFMRRVAPKLKHWLTPEKTLAAGSIDDALVDLTEGAVAELDDAAIATFMNALKQIDTIPLENATEILRVLNGVHRRGIAGESAMAAEIKSAIEPSMRKTMRTVPGAEAAYTKAQTAYGQMAERLYNKTVTGLVNKLKDRPSTLVGAFLRGEAKYDTLLAARKALQSGEGGLKSYIDNVIQPLRHQVITESIDRSTGHFSGQKLARAIDNLGHEAAEEVFGAGGATRIRNLAATLANLQRGGKGGNAVFVQLIQGGMLISGISGLTYEFMESDPTRVGPGARFAIPALVVFMSPVLLTRLTANPQRIRALVDGLEAGPGTQAFGRLTALASSLFGKEKITSPVFTAARDKFYHPSNLDEIEHYLVPPDAPMTSK